VLIDCALLTQRGIAFLLLEQEELGRIQKMMTKDPKARVEVTIECQNRSFVVTPAHILVKYWLS